MEIRACRIKRTLSLSVKPTKVIQKIFVFCLKKKKMTNIFSDNWETRQSQGCSCTDRNTCYCKTSSKYVTPREHKEWSRSVLHIIFCCIDPQATKPTTIICKEIQTCFSGSEINSYFPSICRDKRSTFHSGNWVEEKGDGIKKHCRRTSLKRYINNCLSLIEINHFAYKTTGACMSKN